MFFGRQHLTHDLLFGRRLQTDVDETRACNFNVLHPLLVGRAGQQGVAQLFAQLTRVEFERFGQLHGRGDGKVAMRRHFGRLERGFAGRAGQ